MKKLYAMFIPAFAFATFVMAQSSNSIVNDDGSVQGSVLSQPQPQPSGFTQSACDSITTTYAAGNSHRGNMFDIRTLNHVTLIGLDVHPTGNTTYAVYYKTGTYVGFEADSSFWTLLAYIPGVVAQPQGTPTPLPYVFNLDLPPGDYGFYVSSTDIAISSRYTNGTAVGNVYVIDANMRISEGAGFEWPFTNGGAINTPRVWNGTFHYCPLFDGASEITITPVVEIYPNPAAEHINLRFSEFNQNPVTISLYDETGKKVLEQSMLKSRDGSLKTGALASGLYLLQVAEQDKPVYRTKIGIQ